MTEPDQPLIGGILLAAGGSSRMGKLKQIIEIEGSTLLRRSASELSRSGCDVKVVVLGAESEACEAELDGLFVRSLVNSNWRSGMSTSIRAGLQEILNLEPNVAAVIIALADQPRITTNIFDRFIVEYRSRRPLLIASQYNGISGVPALFSREMFEELMTLEGDRGARSLIEKARNPHKIDVPEAAIDIDSPHDLDFVGEDKR